jgi:PhnB protein
MADPLDALRQPVVPVAPRQAFADELRARLTAELGTPPPSGDPAAAGSRSRARVRGAGPDPYESPYATVTPYLSVSDGNAAIDFYVAVFDAVEVAPRYVGPDGRVGHSELRIGDSIIMVAEEHPPEGVISPDTAGGTTVQLRLDVPDAQATFDRAVAAGAHVWRPVEMAAHGGGDLGGKIRDPFGHNWFIATHVVDHDLDEQRRRAGDLGFDLQVPGADTSPEGPPGRDWLPGAADRAVPVPLPVEQAADAGWFPPWHDERAGQLFYFTLASTAPEATTAFFAALLGWQLRDTGRGFHIGNLEPPGGIHRRGDEPPLTLFFRVDDIRAAVARVRDLGGTVDDLVLYDSGWDASCHDPSGLAFHLSEPAEQYR